jgi:hypothetical protein
MWLRATETSGLFRYEQALEYYQKSLDIKIKVSGQDSLDVAKS